MYILYEKRVYDFFSGSGKSIIHCKKSVLKIQEYIHEGANLMFYIPEFVNFKLLIPEYSPIYRCWFQTAAYFFLQCTITRSWKIHSIFRSVPHRMLLCWTVAARSRIISLEPEQRDAVPAQNLININSPKSVQHEQILNDDNSMFSLLPFIEPE
jgi:hypothetical protein